MTRPSLLLSRYMKYNAVRYSFIFILECYGSSEHMTSFLIEPKDEFRNVNAVDAVALNNYLTIFQFNEQTEKS